MVDELFKPLLQIELMEICQLLADDQLTLAVRRCQELLRNSPECAKAHQLLSIAQQQLGKIDEALASLEQAISLDPEQPSLVLDKARFLRSLGSSTEALLIIEPLLHSHPDLIELYPLLADLYADHRRQVEAAHWREKGRELLERKRRRLAAKEMTSELKERLLAPFSSVQEPLLEAECRLLVRGQFEAEGKCSSCIATSWDSYFTDLSCGSYRDVEGVNGPVYHSRSWHFLYKHLALVDHLFERLEKPSLRLLDVGCATGYLRRFLEGNSSLVEKKQIDYWGLDLRQEWLEKAVLAVDDIESGAKGTSIPSAFIAHDLAYGLPYKREQFDLAVSFETLKYLPIEEGRRLLGEFRRVLVPGGQLLLSHHYKESHPGYFYSVSFAKLESWLQEAGFSIVRCLGSQASFSQLQEAISPSHRPLFDAFVSYHPKELVAAMVAPFYPEVATQRCYWLR